MKNKTSKKTRSRAEILAEIVALPPSVQGTISSYKNVRKNGTSAVYYNLQYTYKGHYPFDDRLGLVGRAKTREVTAPTTHTL